ncbi:MAG: cytochrome c [Deltaproteobacteria bacterium]|nr:cytochrome c [Deltaproteobacteria bacterium]
MEHATWNMKHRTSSFKFQASCFKLLTSCLLLLFSVSCAQAKETAATKRGDPERGKAIYEKYCFYCHGRTGKGDGAVSIAISPHPADFISDKKRMAKSDAELFKSISEGIYRDTGGEEMAMPRWKDILTEQERWDVLMYIRELSRGKRHEAR